MSHTRSISAWFELMRISNAPTVASNVFTGMAVGLLARLGSVPLPWATAAQLLAGTLLVYTAGMVLNDAFDVATDATERPGRPIPSGRIALRHARIVGLAMLLTGMVLLGVAGAPGAAGGASGAGGADAITAFGTHAALSSADHDVGALRSLISRPTIPWALLLGAAVLTYDALHLRLPGALLLMSLCRGCVVIIAALAMAPEVDWAVLGRCAGALFLYVSALSVAARDEVRGLGPITHMLTLALPVLALAPLGLWLLQGITPPSGWLWLGVAGSLMVAAAGAAAGIVAARPRGAGVPTAVGLWIGAIPMMDAAACFLLGRPLLGLLCIGMWGVAGALRPRIAAS